MLRVAAIRKAILDKFGAGKHGFGPGDPLTATPPTSPGFEWHDHVQEEIARVIEAADIELDPTKYDQLLTALFTIARKQLGCAVASAGAAPAFTAAASPAMTAYSAGQRLRVNFHSAGATANTLSVDGLPAKAIKQYDGSGNKIAAAIAAGQLADLEYDGVDWVLLNPLFAGLAAAGFVTLTGNTSMTAIAHLGRTIGLYSATPSSANLPALSTCPVGARLEFMNFGSGAWTVSRLGADQIYTGNASATSLSLGPGDTLVLESRGDYWFAVGGSVQLRYAAIMQQGQLLSGNGYRLLPAYPGDPQPLILQWCTSGSVAAGASGSATFPFAFPNQCLWALSAPLGGAANNNAGNVVTGAASLVGVNLYNWGVIAAPARIFALGN